jgi:hypothetical protein
MLVDYAAASFSRAPRYSTALSSVGKELANEWRGRDCLAEKSRYDHEIKDEDLKNRTYSAERPSMVVERRRKVVSPVTPPSHETFGSRRSSSILLFSPHY